MSLLKIQAQRYYLKDEIRKEIRMQNSTNPISANAAQKLTREHAIFLNQRDYTENYKPEILGDYSECDYGNGNNVDIEEEMMDMAKTGTQYQIMSSLESKMLTNIAQVVKGRTIIWLPEQVKYKMRIEKLNQTK